jgi:hypothetical protein
MDWMAEMFGMQKWEQKTLCNTIRADLSNPRQFDWGGALVGFSGKND